MNIALPTRKVLKAVYRPAFENAQQEFLPYELGIVSPATVDDNPATLVYRKQKNPGGLLKPRKTGESIPQTTAGLDYVDEEVDTYSFSDGLKTSAHEIFGLQSPESINPEMAFNIATVATQHMDELMTRLSNTLRVWASLALVPSVSIGGATFNNEKIIQGDISGSSPWSNPSTDILGYLTTLKKDFFGADTSASTITVLHHAQQTDEIMKNTTLQKVVGFDNGGAALLPPVVAYPRVQAALRQFGIYLYEWSDFYYTANNSRAYENLAPFLPKNYISVIPGAYFNRTPGNVASFQEINPRSGSAPFIEVLSVPDPEFTNKPGRRNTTLPLTMGALEGAYLYSGFPDRGPEVPFTYESFLAARFGLFVEESLRIRYLKVS